MQLFTYFSLTLKKSILISLFAVLINLFFVEAQAQNDTLVSEKQLSTNNQINSCALKVSVLTCGTSQELYSAYGHSAVRVIDVCNGTDIVYNYGTFDFADPEFYMKFTRGKLLYYLNDEEFNNFMNIYVREGRSVHEQILKLSDEDAKLISDFLKNNLKEENKYYKYDFLFDNCSTRVRDIFSNAFKTRFEYARVIADDSVSFRTLLDYYERNVHWERFGINLLLSNKVDDKMTNLQSMFLPDYLENGLAKATLDGNRLVSETKVLLTSQTNKSTLINQPRLLFWILFIGLNLLSRSKTIEPLLVYFDVLFFLILGLLGCFMLFMWLGTEHKVCAWNRNLLWAFPLHVVFAFLIPRKPEKLVVYAKYSIGLLLASMFYSIFAEQKYIAEITPILLLMIWRLSKYSKSINYFGFKNK